MLLFHAAPDQTPPTVTRCPTNITAYAINGYNTTVTWPSPSVYDESGITPTLTYEPFNQGPGSTFNVGDTRITYTFADQAGNEAVCSFVVTVISGRPFTQGYTYMLSKPHLTNTLLVTSPENNACFLFASSQACLCTTYVHMSPCLRDQLNAKDANTKKCFFHVTSLPKC